MLSLCAPGQTASADWPLIRHFAAFNDTEWEMKLDFQAASVILLADKRNWRLSFHWRYHG
jgi:hypothetical protein